MENKDQLVDIYDIWYKPFWQQEWFYGFKIFVACAILGVFFYIIYKKYIQRSIAVDGVLIAFRELHALKNFHIVTKQDSKYCYFSLSLIIKNYLAYRYHINFLRLTDREIVKKAEQYLDEENVRLLQKILQSMVLIKFEHEIAATQRLEQDIACIEEFIKNTTPQRDTKET